MPQPCPTNHAQEITTSEGIFCLSCGTIRHPSQPVQSAASVSFSPSTAKIQGRSGVASTVPASVPPGTIVSPKLNTGIAIINHTKTAPEPSDAQAQQADSTPSQNVGAS